MNRVMPKRAGGAIVNGRNYFWTDWHIDQLTLDEPMCKIPDWVPDYEWLGEMFDDRYSAYLLAMPRENWN